LWTYCTCTQGRLNSIIYPWAKQCPGAHTYTTTYRNKTVNVDKIKHIFIVWELPIKLVFEHYKHSIHNIHRLAWAPMIVDPRETAQCAYALRRHCMYHYCIFLSNSNKIFRILSHCYSSLSVTCDRLVVFSGSSGFLHQ
jgi:hypothetical protein